LLDALASELARLAVLVEGRIKMFRHQVGLGRLLSGWDIPTIARRFSAGTSG